jgi:lipopolysaccharide transport system permease protein
MNTGAVNTGFSVQGGTRDSIFDSLREIWQFRALVLELVRRDLKVRYKNRVGGVLWSLFTPLLQVLTIWAMVRFFLTQIDNYSAYLMTVMFLWQFFQNTVLDSSQAMILNAPLARKIYFPRAVLPLVTLISNLFHFAIAFVFILVYLFVLNHGHFLFPPLFYLAPFCVLGLGVLALGVGYLLAYVCTLYDDARFLSVTFLGLFFYLVPVLYPIEKVAAKQNIYPLYMLNPAATWLVGFQRTLLPPISPPKGVAPFALPLDWLGVACVTSALTLVAGFWIFERSKWMMMERL